MGFDITGLYGYNYSQGVDECTASADGSPAYTAPPGGGSKSCSVAPRLEQGQERM